MEVFELDKLVSLAARANRLEDNYRLFDALRGIELFFNVTVTKENGGDGKAQTPVSTPLVPAGPGLHAVLFFTSRDNVNLKSPYAGIVWERALEMLIAMADADGLIIQSTDASWVGVDRQNAEALLASRSGSTSLPSGKTHH